MATPQQGSQHASRQGARSASKSAAQSGARRNASTKGMLAASACAKDALRSAAGRRGIAEARLITHWPEIAGEKLAEASRPVRVKAPRGMALGGVLVLAVDGARASEVEHAIPQVIEKVNAYYGYGAVAEVKLTQSVSGPFLPLRRPTRPRAVKPEELPTETKAKLDAMTKPIESDALRDALQRLGANVLSRDEAAKEKAAGKKDGKASRGVVRSLSQQARATSPRLI